MKKHLLGLALITAYITSAQSTNTLLWKFYKKGEKPSYLYGTYHSKKITHDDYNDSLDAKIQQVDRIYVEVKQGEMQEASATMMTQFLLKDGKTLKDILSKEEYARYAEFAKGKIGDLYVGLDHMNPLIVSLVLTMIDDMASEMDTSKVSVDAYVEKYAEQNQKEVKGLESASEQVDALKQISLEDAKKSLMETVDKYDEAIALKDKLEQLYKNEDLKGIVKMVEDPKMKADMKMIQGPLLDKRNKIMVERVDAYLKESKKTALVAVGALHLVGKTGLIEALKAKGYTVEPVVSK